MVTLNELPKYTEFFAPILELMADGQERQNRVIVEMVADGLDISPESRAEALASGQNTLNSRVGWALTYLAQAGCLERPRRAPVKETLQIGTLRWTSSWTGAWTARWTE